MSGKLITAASEINRRTAVCAVFLFICENRIAATSEKYIHVQYHLLLQPVQEKTRSLYLAAQVEQLIEAHLNCHRTVSMGIELTDGLTSI
jgi:hypothetical protein